MEPVVEALDAQQRELRALVADLDEAGLARPSACSGWTIADVLLHLAQTNELAVASVHGELERYAEEHSPDLEPGGNVDDYAAALVDLERTTGPEALQRWLRSTEDQVEAFAAAEPSSRVQWVAGEMAARSLAATRLSETWIHTGDIAVGLGVDLAPTERLWHVARLVWRTVPYALAQGGLTASGPVAFELTAPDGSTWRFGTDEDPSTTIRGSAAELCTVAGQRGDAADTDLSATGPDGAEVLARMRTFA